jgi:hypothetical protein
MVGTRRACPCLEALFLAKNPLGVKKGLGVLLEPFSSVSQEQGGLDDAEQPLPLPLKTLDLWGAALDCEGSLRVFLQTLRISPSFQVLTTLNLSASSSIRDEGVVMLIGAACEQEGFGQSLTDLSLVSIGMGMDADSPGVVALAEALRTQGGFLPKLRSLVLDARLAKEAKLRLEQALREGVREWGAQGGAFEFGVLRL